MELTETLETEINRLLSTVDRHKRFIKVATSRVSVMESDLNLHREALEKLKESLAKIDQRARNQRPSPPPETPPKAASSVRHTTQPETPRQPAAPPPQPLRLQEASLRQKHSYTRRAKRVQIKVYKNTYLTGAYKVPGVETNVGLAVHIIREAGPSGVTRPELLERSVQYRAAPLDWQCIGSQLHEMMKRGVVRKEGDRYVAN